MLCVAGSRYVTYEKYGYDQAMRTQIDIGVMSYAGLRDVRSQFFYEVDDDLGSHEEHLRLAYHLGKTFLATERALPWPSAPISGPRGAPGRLARSAGRLRRRSGSVRASGHAARTRRRSSCRWPRRPPAGAW